MKDRQFHALLAFGWEPRDDQGGVIVGAVATHRRPSDPRRFADEFDAAVQRTLLREGSDGVHCVMLSGGLDSRAVLSSLRRHLPSSQLMAATYGVPGDTELETARHVAAETDIEQHVLDVADIEWTGEILTECLADGCPPRSLLKAGFMGWNLHQEVGLNATFWTGFMGDATTGAHLPVRPSRSWRQAVQRWVLWNRATTTRLLPRGMSPRQLLPDGPLVDRGILEFDDQLDLLVRQPGYIRPAVYWPGFDIRSPFADPKWIGYALGLSHSERVGQRLYVSAMREVAPDLFRYRSTYSPSWLKRTVKSGPAGELLVAAKRKLEGDFPPYWDGRLPDYRRLLTEDDDFRGVITQALDNLKRVHAPRILETCHALRVRAEAGRHRRSDVLLHLASVGLAIGQEPVAAS